MAHAVLDQQMAMQGGGPLNGPPPEDGVMGSEYSEFLTKRAPNTLAAMVAGSVLTLIVLRAAGFRFSFGVSVGGGS